MRNYYLAIDIGASSGRHVVGWMENQKLCLEEVYRFENKLIERDAHLCWDMKRLFHEVVEGIARCKRYNCIPKSIGVDTWGVDFVLLDETQEMVGEAVAYRDNRTKDIDKKVYEVISEPDLYYRNGIQKLPFNTIYQLFAVKLQNPDTQDWDWELLEKLGLPKHLFSTIHVPKTVVGCLTEEIQKLVGFNTEVVLPATHDTGSAILAVPANDDDYIYLSSGTWSLMGIERKIADCTEESRVRNFTNEGGYHYRYRYLKNIMGLWLIQSIRQEFKHSYSFDELCTLAKLGSYFPSLVDVNDTSFLAPKSMIQALQDYCERTNQEKPETECEILACAYHSLAKSYADTVLEIEAITAKKYSRIHIVGGGSKDGYLNKLTADYTGKEVYAGPVEATALGNILVQMLKAKDLAELKEAREIIKRSFDIKKVGSEG